MTPYQQFSKHERLMNRIGLLAAALLIFAAVVLIINYSSLYGIYKMKTLYKVNIEPIFLSDLLPNVSEMEDNKIYISEKYKSASHKCLCGCGMETYTMFNRDGSTKHWDLVKESDGVISIIGSIGNFNFPCKSHYIITKNVANFV